MLTLTLRLTSHQGRMACWHQGWHADTEADMLTEGWHADNVSLSILEPQLCGLGWNACFQPPKAKMQVTQTWYPRVCGIRHGPIQGPQHVQRLQRPSLALEPSQELKNSFKLGKNAKKAERLIAGASTSARIGLKLEHRGHLDLPDDLQAKAGYLGVWPRVRNYCARGGPPKTRYSGHQNSRLMRGASKHDQTK